MGGGKSRTSPSRDTVGVGEKSVGEGRESVMEDGGKSVGEGGESVVEDGGKSVGEGGESMWWKMEGRENMVNGVSLEGGRNRKTFLRLK